MSHREQDAYMPTIQIDLDMLLTAKVKKLEERVTALDIQNVRLKWAVRKLGGDVEISAQESLTGQSHAPELQYRPITRKQGWTGVDAPRIVQTECADKPDQMLRDIREAVHNLEEAQADGQKLLHADAAIGRAIYSMPYGSTFHRSDPACGGPEWYIQHFKHTGAVAYATAEETLERAGEIFTKPLAPRFQYEIRSDLVRLQAEAAELRRQIERMKVAQSAYAEKSEERRRLLEARTEMLHKLRRVAEAHQAENAELRRRLEVQRELTKTSELDKAVSDSRCADLRHEKSMMEADKAEILRQLENARAERDEAQRWASTAERTAWTLTESMTAVCSHHAQRDADAELGALVRQMPDGHVLCKNTGASWHYQTYEGGYSGVSAQDALTMKCREDRESD